MDLLAIPHVLLKSLGPGLSSEGFLPSTMTSNCRVEALFFSSREWIVASRICLYTK